MLPGLCNYAKVTLLGCLDFTLPCWNYCIIRPTLFLVTEDTYVLSPLTEEEGREEEDGDKALETQIMENYCERKASELQSRGAEVGTT